MAESHLPYCTARSTKLLILLWCRLGELEHLTPSLRMMMLGAMKANEITRGAVCDSVAKRERMPATVEYADVDCQPSRGHLFPWGRWARRSRC